MVGVAPNVITDYLPSTNTFAAKQVELYENSGGTEGTTMGELPVVIVTSRGARTGKLRKNPLMRVEYDGDYLAVGSAGGAPKDPAWTRNLAANPDVTLRDGPVVSERRARLVTGAERDAWWERAVAAYPPYAEYATRTTREIPLYVLESRD